MPDVRLDAAIAKVQEISDRVTKLENAPAADAAKIDALLAEIAALDARVTKLEGIGTLPPTADPPPVPIPPIVVTDPPPIAIPPATKPGDPLPAGGVQSDNFIIS